jgi:hypothetical protein
MLPVMSKSTSRRRSREGSVSDISTTDISLSNVTTPQRPYHSDTYDGDSTGRRPIDIKPVFSTEHREATRNAAKEAGVTANVDQISILTHCAEVIFNSQAVRNAYNPKKELMMQEHRNTMQCIMQRAVEALQAEFPDLNKDFGSYCIKNLSEFLDYIRQKNAGSLYLKIQGSCTKIQPPDHAKILAKQIMLTHIFQRLIDEDKDMQSQVSSEAKSVVEECRIIFDSLDEPLLELHAANLAKRHCDTIRVPDDLLKAEVIALRLQKIFHIYYDKEYRDTKVINTLPQDLRDDAKVPHAIKVMVNAILTHRKAALVITSMGHSSTHTLNSQYEYQNNSVTETNKLYHTMSKASFVPGIGTYQEIAKKLDEVSKNSKGDTVVAKAIMDILNGKQITGIAEENIVFLCRVTHLLFSTEVERHKHALIINAMFLDLVQKDVYKLSDIVNLPMSCSGAVPAARALSFISNQVNPGHRFDHSTKQLEPDNPIVHNLITNADKICKAWLENTGERAISEQLIYNSCNRWFGMEVQCTGSSADNEVTIDRLENVA